MLILRAQSMWTQTDCLSFLGVCSAPFTDCTAKMNPAHTGMLQSYHHAAPTTSALMGRVVLSDRMTGY